MKQLTKDSFPKYTSSSYNSRPEKQTTQSKSEKKTILSKAIYRFDAILIKLPTVFFTELEQIISQFVWKYKKNSNSQSNLEKDCLELEQLELEESTCLTSVSTAKPQSSVPLVLVCASTIPSVWYRHKDRNIDQWNKIETPEINPCTYGHLIFDKVDKNIQWRKDNLFTTWCWENWSTTYKRMKLEHFLTPYTKIN